MEETIVIILQLLLATTAIGGTLVWVVRGLLYRVLEEARGRAVLVTGADTGIGHQVARHLDSLGFTVFAGCLDTSSEGAQRLRVEGGPGLTLVNLDVRREEHVTAAVQYIEANLPAGEDGLYGLVNNAGVAVCGEFDWQTWDQVEEQVGVNLLGSLRVTRACLPLLKRARGRIVNVSSVAGLYGYPGLSVYCASKHALEGWTQVLRQELEKFGVSVISVQPGDFSKATHLLDSHHSNMNAMWGEMSERSREEYRSYFLAYHDKVGRSGITGRRVKPVAVLPPALMEAFQEALLAKVPAPSYLVLPSVRQRVRMAVVGLLPGAWARAVLHSRYKKSLPPLSTMAA